MLKLKIERKYRINENLYAPCEGIFWIINDELVAFTEQIDSTGRWSTGLEHIKIWEEIKNDYKVDNKIVSYNYFPRGRVMVNPVRVNDVLSHYDIFIYLDNCINNSEIVDFIKYEYHLNGDLCKIKYVGADGGITDNHYMCHMCRK